MAEYFQRHGMTVRGAADAAQARALLATQTPQLAVLDINMPGENGLSLARWMRESRPQVGIVMLSTASEAIDRVLTHPVVGVVAFMAVMFSVFAVIFWIARYPMDMIDGLFAAAGGYVGAALTWLAGLLPAGLLHNFIAQPVSGVFDVHLNRHRFARLDGGRCDLQIAIGEGGVAQAKTKGIQRLTG